MSVITVDTKQGMATDVGDFWCGDQQTDPIRVIVDIALTDENEMSFSYMIGKKQTNLYLPIERVQALLKEEKICKKNK
jgi:hypothetical protein